MSATLYEAGGPFTACNQLFCDGCNTPVKHMEGVLPTKPPPRDRGRLYDSLDPDDWLDYVELKPAWRFYFCRCAWYATAGGKPAQHLDTVNIDHWGCPGHPEPR